MSTDTYQLKWHSHSSHMNGSVASLLRSEKYTDVVLCTMDGSQIPAHKFILSSCSLYLNNLFDGQRAVMRLGNAMLYVVLPSEISTKALQVLIEYMYKGETTVSNEVLDMVLKAGEALKIRGLWRQAEVSNEIIPSATNNIDNNVENAIMPTLIQKPVHLKKPETADTGMPKISVKRDEKLLKSFAPVSQQNLTRPMFIGPPKLVFIKTTEASSGLRPLAPKPTAQTIIVTPDLPPKPVATVESQEIAKVPQNAEPMEELSKVMKKVDKKYAKKLKTSQEKSLPSTNSESSNDGISQQSTKSEFECNPDVITKVMIKDEPFWEEGEEEIHADPEVFHSELKIKPDIEESSIIDDDDEEQIYSPLTCELCAEVFTIPAAWVRHIEGHANSSTQPTRKRKYRSASDDTEETTALLRCDLCQKHFPNPAEWVRHIQSTHTETELAISNNSAPPKRHNRFTEGIQNKTCDQCKKRFPSHASMVIHMRTHTGERPFLCGLCNKGFNVKSNLLRHLRTLHDQIVHPTQLYDPEEGPDDDDEPVETTPSTSTIVEEPPVPKEDVS